MAALLVGGPSHAGETREKAQAAEDKAEVLEEKAASQAPVPADTPPITRSEARAVDPDGEAPLDDPITCLARSIYWEAKGAPAQDMESVANVVMNRLGDGAFPKTVCAVVKQGSESRSCQFSWWCDGRPDEAVEDDRFTLAREIARKALNGQLRDRTDGALYFHDRNVSPSWAKKFTRTAQTQRLLFYKPRLEEPLAGTQDGAP